MEWVETTGKSVAEAIGIALDELGVDEHDAEVVIVEEPKPGLFGLRKSGARVRARVRPAPPRPKRPQRARRGRGERSDRPAKSEHAPRPTEPKAAPEGHGASGGGRVGVESGTRRGKHTPPRSDRSPSRNGEEPTMSVEEQVAAVTAFVSGVVERFGYDAETTARVEDEHIFVDVTGNELGLLIGPRGATLDALQELTRTVIQRRTEEHAARVIVDVAGFRAKRAEALSTFARGVAADVLASGVAEALEPMSSSDRKIVHDTVNSIDGVVTTSEGADPRRYVVVRPVTSEDLAEA